MSFDLELALVIAVFVTGIVWFFDWLIWGERRRKKAMMNATQQAPEDRESAKSYKEPWYVEYAKSFFPVLLIVLILRSFIAEPFRIPSGSMIPTLLVGDFILVNKFAYGLRLPVTHTEVLELGSPDRGDVIVFRYPNDPSTDYIKRVVGLPGDHIEYRRKSVYVNGQLMPQTDVGHYQGVGAIMDGAEVFREKLGGDKHSILIHSDTFRPPLDRNYVVPPHHYFVLGDNRDNSNDSRYWGFVPEKNLIGKAFLVWMNWDIPNGNADFGRIGDKIN